MRSPRAIASIKGLDQIAPDKSGVTLRHTATKEQAVDEPVNKTLGQFQLTCELGRGGMAVVYEAYQTTLQRKVALKVLLPSVVNVESTIR